MITHKQNRGFTLLEMAVALAVLSLMAAYMTPNFLEQINEDRAHATIQETQAILDAARVYRRDTGTWPGGATCSTAWTVLTTGANPYLAGVTANNKYNSPYLLSCTSNNFRVQQNLTADWDSYVANKLPSTTITNSATYTIASSVGIPGTEPALSSKLSRIATGNPEDVTMRTDLLMGGNDITGVGGIDASSVNVTGATNTGSLAVTGNATVAGRTQTGTLGVTGNAHIGGNAGVVGTTTLNGALTVNTTSRFNGAADFREIVKLNKVVTEGSACSDIGALARTSTGLTLSCQSGVWKGSGGSSAYALGQPGWWCDKDSGYTMQWGAGPALGVDASTYVTFPRTMTAGYSVTGTGIGAPSGGNGPTLQARSLTGSGFIMSNDYYSTGGFYWFATGYTPGC